MNPAPIGPLGLRYQATTGEAVKPIFFGEDHQGTAVPCPTTQAVYCRSTGTSTQMDVHRIDLAGSGPDVSTPPSFSVIARQAKIVSSREKQSLPLVLYQLFAT